MMEARDTRSPRLIMLLLIAVALCPVAPARTLRVDDDGPADYPTIQAAIDAAADGDAVLVTPGTYTGDGNRDIDFKGKAITVRSEAGPRTCTIDCQASKYDCHRGFYFRWEEQADSILDGFTITGGYQFLYRGSGIVCAGSSPTIRNCIISGNVAMGGGGLALDDSDSVVSNCIIAGNSSISVDVPGYGGGFIFSGDGHSILRNCTIYGNYAERYGGGVAVGLGRRGKVSLINCILFANRAYYGSNQINYGPSGAILPPMGCEVVNCLIEDEPNAVGGGQDFLINCIRGDPLFADPGWWNDNNTPGTGDDLWVDGDYHVKSQAGRWDPNAGEWVRDEVTSPCIDAGDPNSPIGHEPFPNGGRINLGAYGGTAEASKSPSGLSAKYGGGGGEAADPYLVFTAEHLREVGTEPGDWGRHFRLMADIDLRAGAGEQAAVIGTGPDAPFVGVFDGDGHTITGFVCGNPLRYDSVGLFAYVSGTVRNLGLIDPNVDGGLGYYAGALVGDNHGLISNCFVEDANVAGGNWYAGGLVGRNEGTIKNCRSAGAVGGRSAGGLVHLNRGRIEGCSSTAAAAGDDRVGGLVGDNSGGTIINSWSAGTVTGDDKTGGLVGGNSDGTITGCYSTATVFGNDGVGGLVGENWGGTIADCYAAANVTGDRLTAALVGDNGAGTIHNCYASGPTVGRWPVGGLVAFRHDDDTVIASFWDTETTGCPWSAAGTGKTTAEMQTAATFLNADWDFVDETNNGTEDLWQIREGQDYPRLSWEVTTEPDGTADERR